MPNVITNLAGHRNDSCRFGADMCAPFAEERQTLCAFVNCQSLMLELVSCETSARGLLSRRNRTSMLDPQRIRLSQSIIRRAVSPKQRVSRRVEQHPLVQKWEPRANQLSLPGVNDEVTGDLFMGRGLWRQDVKDPDWRPNQTAAWAVASCNQLRRLYRMSGLHDRSAVGRSFQNLHSLCERVQFT